MAVGTFYTTLLSIHVDIVSIGFPNYKLHGIWLDKTLALRINTAMRAPEMSIYCPNVRVRIAMVSISSERTFDFLFLLFLCLVNFFAYLQFLPFFFAFFALFAFFYAFLCSIYA